MPLPSYALGAMEASVYAPEVLARALPSALRREQQPERNGEPTGSAATVPLLSLQGIGLSFGGVVALADIDLSVHPGEIRAIMDEDWCHAVRTAAAATVAMRVLARKDSSVMAMLGAGDTARAERAPLHGSAKRAAHQGWAERRS